MYIDKFSVIFYLATFMVLALIAIDVLEKSLDNYIRKQRRAKK